LFRPEPKSDSHAGKELQMTLKHQSGIFLLMLAVFGILTLVSCGDGGSSNNTANQADKLDTILISPKATMFTKPGETQQLTSTAYNDNGSEVAANLQWSSSNPAAITVDKNGLVTSVAEIGSALISASSEGVVSNEIMIVIASPVQGAILVSDDQVVGDIQPEDPNPEWGLGVRFKVRLAGIPLPPVGTILLGTGEKPIGGKVVSALQDGDGVEVTLELVTIPELFSALVIDEQINLSSQIPILAELLADNYDITWSQDGNLVFTLKEQTNGKAVFSPNAGVPIGTSLLNPDANYGPFECASAFPSPLVLDGLPTSFTITNNLWLDFLYDSNQGGFQHSVLRGDVQGTFKVSNTLSAALQYKVTCKTTLAKFSYPLPGALGAIWGHIPLGVGFEVDGKITVAQVGFELQLDGKATVETGIQCPNGGLGLDCDMLGDLDVDTNADFKWITPDFSSSLETLAQLRLEPSLSAFAFAALEIGFPPPFDRILSAEVAQAQFGVKQSGNLAIVEGQMDDQQYSSNYLLSLDASIGSGATIESFLNFMQINLLKTEVKFTDPLAESPKIISTGIDKTHYQPGETVKFTVNLDPRHIDYPIIGYNVSNVLIYRQTDGGSGGVGPAELLVEKVPAQGQTQVILNWIADSEGSIGEDLFAFVETYALPFHYFGQLEVAKCAEVIMINDIPLHLGDLADGTYGTQYDGTADIPDAPNFTSATLEVEFLGKISEPFRTSGIDFYPTPNIVEINGYSFTITEDDVPDPNCIAYYDQTDQYPAPCESISYDCPFTYRLDITTEIIPHTENSVSVISAPALAGWCVGNPWGIDNFGIGEIRIILH
jgi:hypothetical protein